MFGDSSSIVQPELGGASSASSHGDGRDGFNLNVTGCEVLSRSGVEQILHVYMQSLHIVVIGTAAIDSQR